jgi:hypothetical protein
MPTAPAELTADAAEGSPGFSELSDRAAALRRAAGTAFGCSGEVGSGGGAAAAERRGALSFSGVLFVAAAAFFAGGLPPAAAFFAGGLPPAAWRAADAARVDFAGVATALPSLPDRRWSGDRAVPVARATRTADAALYEPAG